MSVNSLLFPNSNKIYADEFVADTFTVTGGIDIQGTDGSTLYIQNNQIKKLPIGADGKVLKVNGGIPSWQTDDTTETASELKTTGSNVVIGSSAPPTAGQILKANSPTSASWQDDSGSGSLQTAYDNGNVINLNTPSGDVILDAVAKTTNTADFKVQKGLKSFSVNTEQDKVITCENNYVASDVINVGQYDYSPLSPNTPYQFMVKYDNGTTQQQFSNLPSEEFLPVYTNSNTFAEKINLWLESVLVGLPNSLITFDYNLSTKKWQIDMEFEAPATELILVINQDTAKSLGFYDSVFQLSVLPEVPCTTFKLTNPSRETIYSNLIWRNGNFIGNLELQGTNDAFNIIGNTKQVVFKTDTNEVLKLQQNELNASKPVSINNVSRDGFVIKNPQSEIFGIDTLNRNIVISDSDLYLQSNYNPGNSLYSSFQITPSFYKQKIGLYERQGSIPIDVEECEILFQDGTYNLSSSENIYLKPSNTFGVKNSLDIEQFIVDNQSKVRVVGQARKGKFSVEKEGSTLNVLRVDTTDDQITMLEKVFPGDVVNIPIETDGPLPPGDYQMIVYLETNPITSPIYGIFTNLPTSYTDFNQMCIDLNTRIATVLSPFIPNSSAVFSYVNNTINFDVVMNASDLTQLAVVLSETFLTDTKLIGTGLFIPFNPPSGTPYGISLNSNSSPPPYVVNAVATGQIFDSATSDTLDIRRFGIDADVSIYTKSDIQMKGLHISDNGIQTNGNTFNINNLLELKTLGLDNAFFFYKPIFMDFEHLGNNYTTLINNSNTEQGITFDNDLNPYKSSLKIQHPSGDLILNHTGPNFTIECNQLIFDAPGAFSSKLYFPPPSAMPTPQPYRYLTTGDSGTPEYLVWRNFNIAEFYTFSPINTTFLGRNTDSNPVLTLKAGPLTNELQIFSVKNFLNNTEFTTGFKTLIGGQSSTNHIEKLAVKNSADTLLFSVDTVNNKILNIANTEFGANSSITALGNLVIKGTGFTNKFVIEDELNTPAFTVSTFSPTPYTTTTTKVSITGANDANKFEVKNNTNTSLLNVNSTTDDVVIRKLNSASSAGTLYTTDASGLLTTLPKPVNDSFLINDNLGAIGYADKILNSLNDVQITSPLVNQRLLFDGSKWINNIRAKGEIWCNALSGTAPTAATNIALGFPVFYPINYTGVVYTQGTLQDFVLNANTLQYTGTITKTFHCTYTPCLEPANNDRDFRVIVSKETTPVVYPTAIPNGDILTNSLTCVTLKDGTPNSTSSTHTFCISLAQNDYIQLGIASVQTNQDVVFNGLYLSLIEL